MYDTNTRPVYRHRMTLGKRIQAARKAAGLTQAQLTEACGWEPGSRLANYEQGTREPSLADLKLIAEKVKAGGHTYAQIVLGEAQGPSQPVGLDGSRLAAAIQLARKSVAATGDDSFDPEDAEDAEIVLLALAHLSAKPSKAITPSVVADFRTALEKGNDARRHAGQAGLGDRSKGAAQTGTKGRVAGDRKRKSA